MKARREAAESLLKANPEYVVLGETVEALRQELSSSGGTLDAIAKYALKSKMWRAMSARANMRRQAIAALSGAAE